MSQRGVFLLCFDLLILCRFFISWKELSIQQSSPSRVMYICFSSKGDEKLSLFLNHVWLFTWVCMSSKLNIFCFEFFSVQSFKGISHSFKKFESILEGTSLRSTKSLGYLNSESKVVFPCSACPCNKLPSSSDRFICLLFLMKAHLSLRQLSF